MPVRKNKPGPIHFGSAKQANYQVQQARRELARQASVGIRPTAGTIDRVATRFGIKADLLQQAVGSKPLPTPNKPSAKKQTRLR